MSGGGTAGHVYPALALAHKLRAEGYEVLFVGTPDSVEERLVKAEGIAFEAIDVKPLESDYTIWRGPDKAKYSTLITSPLSWIRARKPAGRIIETFRPDVVVGFGGYVCAPIVWAADRRGVPIVLHEQNSVMGKANKSLARKASAVALTYECAREDLDADSAREAVLTGNPVRPPMTATSRKEAREALGLSDDEVFMLVFGGSRGARNLNNAVAGLASEILKSSKVRLMHATGERDYEAIAAISTLPSSSYHIVPYIENMEEVMPAADVIIARAGSTTIAEISELGIPAILVPFPHATEDHQTKNAQLLVDAGAALLVHDDELDTSLFADTIYELIEKPDKRMSMHEASKTLPIRNALETLSKLVKDQGTRR